MIHVIATIELNEGARDEFLARFHELMPQVHQEEGCIEYGPAVDVQTAIAAQGEARENVVTVVEKWESLEHLEAHLIAPHMLRYREDVKPLVTRTMIQVLRPA